MLKQWCGALGERPVGDITKSEILGFLNKYLAKRKDGSGRIAANNLRRSIRHVFRWAHQHDLIDSNPAEGVAKPQPRTTSRDRCLDTEEIKAFWSACDAVGWPTGPIFKLLLLTGQRESEVGKMERGELKLKERLWEIPGPRTKNRKRHTVHLSDLAIEIIEKLPQINGSKYVFTTTGQGPIHEL